MSGKTAYEKIVAKNRVASLYGKDVLKCDRVWCHEITTPIAILDMEKRGWDKIFNPNKVFFMIDHVNPAKDTDTAIQGKIMRDFAKKHNIKMFDVGQNGVCHALIPESGLVLPGDVGIMGDSHTCTHGAFCTLSFGVGTTDLETGLITGNVAIGQQSVIRVNFVGELPHNVFSKDLILALLAKISTKGATNAILEFGGNVIDEMTMEQRMTITNMSVEAGATSGVMMVDKHTIDYLWPVIAPVFEDREEALLELSKFNSDNDCEYAETITIDVTDMQPMITVGTSPDGGVEVGEIIGKKVDQVYIGSCTNGRIEDFRIVAHIFEKTGASVCAGVRCIITPTTQEVQQQMVDEGIFTILSKAGCAMSGPTCGACLGMSNGVLAPGEVCVSTTNRNFPGRMGKGSTVHLTSPAVAAVTAISGFIDLPSEDLLSDFGQHWAIDNVAKPATLTYVGFESVDYSSLLDGNNKSKLNFGGMFFHLLKDNIDTDQIIPAKYLTKVELSVFGEHCLEDVGLDDLQKAQLKPAKVLIAGENFGCGSSREHAVYAFSESGINTIIAPSFARIFESNMFNNGKLCITLPQQDIDKILNKCMFDVLVIDIENGTISTKHTDEEIVSFTLSEHQKELVLLGGSIGKMIELAATLNSREDLI